MKGKLLFIAVILLFNAVQGQTKKITVKYFSNADIKIDGVMNEANWQQTTPADDFWLYFPTDSLKAKKQTEIRMIYSDKFLYIGVKVYTAGNKYNIKSLMRDAGTDDDDNINFLFDTFNDGNNAFYFSVNPYGQITDGYLSRGGVDGKDDLDINWSVKWTAESKIYDEYYIAEMKIPFYGFKYINNIQNWRFNCFRNDPQVQKKSSWIRIPLNQKIQNLAYMGKMEFEKPLKKQRNPFSLIPYALYSFEQNNLEGTKTNKPGFGGDVKLRLGTDFITDFTINPDFSNTDVTEKITNTSRFELNLPETRQFFIDNSDLFADFGQEKLTQAFYSRRIGYGKDTLNNDIAVPIIAGGRITGKITEDLRVGVLDVQTAEKGEDKIPANNNLVVALQQRVLKNSNIAGIFINRQATNTPDFLEESKKYNRVIGMDFNYYSDGNRLVGKAYLHKSFTPETGGADISAGVKANYNVRHFTSEEVLRYVGNDFKSDLGFIKRKNIMVANFKDGPKFYPKNNSINNWGIFGKGTFEWQASTWKYSDHNYGVLFVMKFNNLSELRSEAMARYTYLFEPFDPTKTPGAVPLPVGGYNYFDTFVKFTSNQSKLFSYIANVKGGSYYSGYKFTAEFTMKYRVQPFFNSKIKVNYDYISLPDPHPTESILYVGPQIEFTFTKKWYWTTDVQFNSQDENLGIKSRLQWRYSPLSDIFIIYTDNYRTPDYVSKTRALFFKITYWFDV